MNEPECANCSKTAEDGGNFWIAKQMLFHESCMKCGDCGKLLAKEFCCILNGDEFDTTDDDHHRGETMLPRTKMEKRCVTYCPSCYEIKFVKNRRCKACSGGFKWNESIINETIVSGIIGQRHDQRRWHQKCFVCGNAACKKQIKQMYFVDSGKARYCSMQCLEGKTTPVKALGPSTSAINVGTPPSSAAAAAPTSTTVRS